jgi:hypothetical protein
MNHEEMLELKVGDVVCDCAFEHLPIVSIEDERFPTESLRKYFGWLLIWPIPTFLFDFLYDRWDTEVGDKQLTLEGGRMCSAIHCAHLVPHEWSHEDV